MAELSAETQAILDRLKSEGQLTRNSGTNSIRSVKVQLDRFEGIFNTISANVAEQTSLLRKSMNIQEEAIEAQRRKDDLEELAQPVQDTEKPSTEPSDDKKEKEKSKGIFDFLAGVGGSLFGALKPLLIGGAGLFVAYNFAKGYIDSKTGGGFTAFENSMIDTFNEVDWTALGNSFKEFALKIPEAVQSIVDFLSDPLSAILAAAGLTAAGILTGFGGGALARGVTRGIIDGVLGNQRSAGRGRGGGGLFNLRNVARTSALGILTGALIFYGDDVKNWLVNQGVPENWAAVGVDAATAISGALTLGAMFGPPGLIVGAVAGTAYVLGRALYRWFEGNREKARLAAQARIDAMNVITGEGLGEETGAANTTVSSVMTTTDEARSLAAEQADDRVAAIFQKVRDGGSLTDAEKAILRDAFASGDARIASDRYAQINSQLMGEIGVAAGIGREEDEIVARNLELALNRLESIRSMANADTGNVTLENLFNQGLLNATTRLSQELEYLDEIRDEFSPEVIQQLERLKRLQSEGLLENLPMQSSSLDARNAEILDMVAQAGVGSGMSSVVIGKMGGDNYITQQTTRLGDQNVADVQVIRGGGVGGDSNPLSLVG